MMVPAYVLYSKTRKVLYINDKPHTAFWSHYIQRKYPKDKWIVGQETEFEIIDTLRNTPTYKRINLMDSQDIRACKLHEEIYKVKEEMAINQLLNISTYVVSRKGREAAIIDYAGPNYTEAMKAYLAHKQHATFEVWKNDRYAGELCDGIDFSLNSIV